jgi:hypothetical protein
MGKNKAQIAQEEREAKTTATPKPAVETKAATPAPATPGPSKQDQTIARLRAGWEERKIDLSKLAVKDDGKFKVLIVAAGWPSVQVGASGGITVLELKSYPDAFTGAMEGLDRYTKQQARDQKKAAAAATPVVAKAVTASAPVAPAVPVKARAAA